MNVLYWALPMYERSAVQISNRPNPEQYFKWFATTPKSTQIYSCIALAICREDKLRKLVTRFDVIYGEYTEWYVCC